MVALYKISSSGRGKRQIWTKHKDKGSFGCHHPPPLCCFEWSKLARWTWQNSQSADWEFWSMPLYIEFASKKLKTKDNYYARCQLSMEALVCSTNHLGVIKFMPSMQKPCRHTNCGGTKAHVGRCWSMR
jgi:hypothetical protein